MWVRSKDKELLIYANCFYLQNSYNGKNYNIMASVDGNESFVVARYETKEEANEQLDKLHWALQNLGKNVFQIR